MTDTEEKNVMFERVISQTSQRRCSWVVIGPICFCDALWTTVEIGWKDLLFFHEFLFLFRLFLYGFTLD